MGKLINKIKDKISNFKLYYKNIEEDKEYELGSLHFIWGLKSYDDITSGSASLYTMNDLEIDYDNEQEKYILSIESIYFFDSGEKSAASYLKYLLKEFTLYMKDHNLDTDIIYSLHEFQMDIWSAYTIEELYFKFKIFVQGYLSVIGEEL